MGITGGNIFVEILAWIGITFVAGFIGYFGRHLALVLIDRARTRKQEQQGGEAGKQGRPETSADSKYDSQAAKIEKKKAKAGAKRAKKENKD